MDPRLSYCFGKIKAERQSIDKFMMQHQSLLTNDSLDARCHPHPAVWHEVSLFSHRPYGQSARRALCIESNHKINNLSFKALPAQMPLKDGVHMRYHDSCNPEKRSHKQNGKSEPLLEENRFFDYREEQRDLEKEGLAPKLHASFIRDFAEAPSGMLLELATQSKASSLQMQYFVEISPPEYLLRITELIQHHLSILITHKFGSYLIQKMLLRDRRTVGTVATFCRRQFINLSNNEYSSRVMQRVIEQSADFRKFANASFKKNLEYYLQSVPSGFLVSSAIAKAQTEDERDILSEYLQKNPSRWFENKYLKKILVTYLTSCSSEKLNHYSAWLKIDQSVFSFLQDKHSCFILLKFLERKHRQTRQIVLDAVWVTPITALSSKFFGYFVGQLIKKEETRGFACELHRILTSLSKNDYSTLQQATLIYQVS